MSSRDSRCHGISLGADAKTVRGVLHVGAEKMLTADGQGGTDTKSRIGRVGFGLRRLGQYEKRIEVKIRRHSATLAQTACSSAAIRQRLRVSRCSASVATS